MAGRRRQQVLRSRRSGQNGPGRTGWGWVLLGLAGLALVVGVCWWRWRRPVDFPVAPAGEGLPPIPSPGQRPRPSGENPIPDLPALPPSFAAFPTNEFRTNRPSIAINLSTNIVRSDPGPLPALLPVDAIVPDLKVDARRPTTWLLAQIALAAHGISAGPIDGVGGAQSILALRAFQTSVGLEPTGQLDRETVTALQLRAPAFSEFTVTAGQLARLHPVPKSWIGKSQVVALDFENLPELVGEMTHSHPELVRRLNPTVDWTQPKPGLRLTVPRTEYPLARRAALIRISLAGKWLRVFDEKGHLLAHFPCSIGARIEKRPVGTLAVAVAVKDPNYTFDPATFPESAEAQAIDRRLVLPPGPNNPVGVAWIGLNRSGYGIHGTPTPELVGRTESHGCFRLANWNAEYLRQMSWPGLPVRVEW